jgi:inorganic pyrophosphatase
MDLDPGKWAKVERWRNADEARRIVAETMERAKQQAG